MLKVNHIIKGQFYKEIYEIPFCGRVKVILLFSLQKFGLEMLCLYKFGVCLSIQFHSVTWSPC